MNENRQEINKQPISFLSELAEIIDGMLEGAEETLQNISSVEKKLYVLEDQTVDGMLKVYGNSKQGLWMYDEQLKIWMRTKLNDRQYKEVRRLQSQMVKLKKVVGKILSLAEQAKKNTIETVLAKDNVELALEILTGKRKLPI